MREGERRGEDGDRAEITGIASGLLCMNRGREYDAFESCWLKQVADAGWIDKANDGGLLKLGILDLERAAFTALMDDLLRHLDSNRRR